MRSDCDVDRQFGQKLTYFDIFATSCLVPCGDDGPTTLNFEHFFCPLFLYETIFSTKSVKVVLKNSLITFDSIVLRI